MAVLFALIAAAAYGISDFAAGLMARKASVFTVTLISEAAATVVVWAALPFSGGMPDRPSLLWGAFAGLGGAGGAMFLYRGLARGSMSIIGPVSAVVTAAGSAVVGVATGDRPGLVAAGGVVLACVAVGLVSRSEPIAAVPPGQAWRALLNATAAGLGFVVLFVGLNHASASAGIWPVAVETAVALLFAAVTVGIALLRRHERLSSMRHVLAGSAVAGVLGGGATVAFSVSTHRGPLTVTAVITSLYPAATVLLALGLLRERLRRVQALGVGLALAAVALLSAAQS
ncbi:MAG: EamA family transporter [Candidatus Dormibacteraeota bacterium]|uniref:EamA family transporter n=1 Tax=Candidatus Aeolococcus gillhamiae TaxID=3127015 RepID=A0A934N6Y9_9BACT|nr:EamA family transporter [Candidatus Dormibacteraeota bacterium]